MHRGPFIVWARCTCSAESTEHVLRRVDLEDRTCHVVCVSCGSERDVLMTFDVATLQGIYVGEHP